MILFPQLMVAPLVLITPTPPPHPPHTHTAYYKAAGTANVSGRSDPLPASDCCSACQLTDETITGYTTSD